MIQTAVCEVGRGEVQESTHGLSTNQMRQILEGKKFFSLPLHSRLTIQRIFLEGVIVWVSS